MCKLRTESHIRESGESLYRYVEVSNPPHGCSIKLDKIHTIC